MFIIPCLLILKIATICKACTNFIVTPGASDDGSMILAYNSDDHDTYGMLYHYAANNFTQTPQQQRPMRKVWDWETA
jgi:dipeptidase